MKDCLLAYGGGMVTVLCTLALAAELRYFSTNHPYFGPMVVLSLGPIGAVFFHFVVGSHD